MIKVLNLSKRYGQKDALKDASFHVSRGEIFGFLGPNGAGKTTTIKILSGQIAPTGGTAYIMDMDVTREQSRIQANMGIVPEKANLYERLTIEQNLDFFCRLYNADRSQIDYYLHRVGLLQEKSTPVGKLSKGMKQKVLLIRALLHKPSLLFLDEPTSGLDPASAATIHTILRQLNEEGMTIFLTSHNMEEVEKLCHRVAFLNEGSIVAAGTPEELKLQYAARQLRVLLEGEETERILEIDEPQTADAVAAWLRAGKVRSIHSSEPTLADIFVRLTGRDIQ
ncbi:MAG: ABC transporter ATP-binding protein [Firmicutes bacterium]|nr:ABC transporter ATP-binding protein [Bacillota bacterium]